MKSFKEPEDTKRLKWTLHAKRKMKYYRLSASRVKRVLFHPERREKGIVEGTVALMQIYGNKGSKKEIWVMYEKTDEKFKIITAWRYPGRSPKRKPPPVPEDIRKELLRT